MPRPGLRRLSSRAQDPSMRRVYRTPRTTVRRRPSSPSASRALSCASRQPRLCTLPGTCRTERLARAPSRRHPAPPCPSRRAPPQGGTRRWTSKTLCVEPSTSPAPHEASWRPNPSRSSTWSPFTTLRRLWGRPRRHWLSPLEPALWTRPFARSESVVGPPVARWAGSHGISSLVDSARRCERTSGAGLFVFRVTPTDVSPRSRRARHQAAGRPSTPHRLASERRPHGLRRGGHRLSLSRARRAFAHRGVLRVASFRRPSSLTEIGRAHV